MSTEELDDILNHKRRMLGISGRSGDLRDLEKAAVEGDTRSELAIELFALPGREDYWGICGRAGRIGRGCILRGELGENSASMRERICRRLGIFGVSVDRERNNAQSSSEPMQIGADESRVQVWVIHADENLEMRGRRHDA